MLFYDSGHRGVFGEGLDQRAEPLDAWIDVFEEVFLLLKAPPPPSCFQLLILRSVSVPKVTRCVSCVPVLPGVAAPGWPCSVGRDRMGPQPLAHYLSWVLALHTPPPPPSHPSWLDVGIDEGACPSYCSAVQVLTIDMMSDKTMMTAKVISNNPEADPRLLPELPSLPTMNYLSGRS